MPPSEGQNTARVRLPLPTPIFMAFYKRASHSWCFDGPHLHRGMDMAGSIPNSKRTVHLGKLMKHTRAGSRRLKTERAVFTSRAAVTKCPKLGDLEQQKLIVSHSEGTVQIKVAARPCSL